MPTFATDHDSTTQHTIEKWKIAAREEVEMIGAWRDADADNLAHYWTDGYTFRGGGPPEIPNMFYTNTTCLVGEIVARYPKLDPAPLQDVYAAIAAWYADHSAARIPPQPVLFATLERAMMTLQAIEHDIQSRVVYENQGKVNSRGLESAPINYQLSPGELATLEAIHDWELDPPESLFENPKSDPVSPVPLYLIAATLHGSGFNVDASINGLLKRGLIRQTPLDTYEYRNLHRRTKNGNLVKVEWGYQEPRATDPLTGHPLVYIHWRVNDGVPPKGASGGNLHVLGNARIRQYTIEPEGIELLRRRRSQSGQDGIALPELPAAPAEADGKADARKRKGQQAVAKQEMERLDLISSAVAVQEFCVSRSTLKRAVARGKLRDYRPKNSPANAAYRLSRAEVAGQWPARI